MLTINNNFIWGEPMKKSILFLLLFASTFISANNKLISQYTTIEENLLVGLSSENQGLKLSSAYFLGEIKSDKAIIPLMNLFHNSKEFCARQVAALALFKIDSKRGMYAIKQAIQFDENPQTRKICSILYNQHLLRKQNIQIEVEPIFVLKLNLKYGDYKLIDFGS